jgi:uncharacterized protein YjiS (DUF1127 family)
VGLHWLPKKTPSLPWKPVKLCTRWPKPRPQPPLTCIPKIEKRPPISLLKILHCFKTAYRLGRQRYRQRRQLMEMDHRQLKDIGITREQAEREARKPIWKD